MFLWFLPLIAIGTFWWWIITLVFVGFAVLAEENEACFWALALLVGYGLCLQFWFSCGFIGYFFANPLHLLYFALGYTAGGLIWSAVKWMLYTNKQAEYKEAEYERWLKKEDLEPGTKTLTKRQGASLKSSGYDNYCSKPLFRDNKKKITIWVTYWPLSFIWSLINDFVKKFFRFVVTQFRVVYESIANRAYKNVDNITIEE